MDLSNGLILIIQGMGGVFAILTIMFIFLKIVLYIDSKIKVKQPDILPAKVDLLKKAAIVTAINHHKKRIEGKNG